MDGWMDGWIGSVAEGNLVIEYLEIVSLGSHTHTHTCGACGGVRHSSSTTFWVCVVRGECTEKAIEIYHGKILHRRACVSAPFPHPFHKQYTKARNKYTAIYLQNNGWGSYCFYNIYMDSSLGGEL